MMLIYPLLSFVANATYDGAAAMKGIRSGIAKPILDEEPRALL